MRRRGILALLLSGAALWNAGPLGPGAVHAASQPTPPQTASAGASAAGVALHPGFNLVGWTGEHMPAAAIAAAVGSAFQAAYAFDSATQGYRSFQAGLPAALNSLQTVEPGMAIWLRVSRAATLAMPRLAAPVPVPLQAGFNLLAWAGPDDLPISAAIASLGADVTGVYLFEAATQQYRSFVPGQPAFLQTASALRYGDGVWVRMARAREWPPEQDRLWGQIPADDDLADPGLPAQKRDWHEGTPIRWQGPHDPDTALEVDAADFVVQRRMIHSTEVVLAVHRSLSGISSVQGHPIPTVDEFMDYMFASFHHHWHVFGGFPYDRYTVKVLSLSDTPGWSLSPVGIVMGATTAEERALPNYPPLYYSRALYPIYGVHEMLHSWNGKTLALTPSGDGRLFTVETWLSEGATGYLGDRLEGVLEGLDVYERLMATQWQRYTALRGTAFDLSYEDLTFAIGGPEQVPPPFTEHYSMLGARDHLLNYRLDVALNALGYSIEDLLRYLYQRFALEDRTWAQADILDALEAITGQRFGDLFQEALYSTAPVPLDGTFLWVNHHPGA